jgi:hypothetical protein
MSGTNQQYYQSNEYAGDEQYYEQEEYYANQYEEDQQYYDYVPNHQQAIQHAPTHTVVQPQVEEYITLPRQQFNHRHPIKHQDSFTHDQVYQERAMPAAPLTELPNSSTAHLVDTKEDLYPKLGGEKQRRCMYGCVPTNKKSRYICIGSIVFFLLVAGVLGFIFFPRFPEMRVSSINVAPGNSFTLTAVDLTKEDLDFRFELGMIMNISVRNVNSYTLRIEAIDLSAFVMANTTFLNQAIPFPAEQLFSRIDPNRPRVTEQNRKQKIGSGIRKEPIVFPPGREIFFQMNFLVAYVAKKEFNTVSDPALNEIIQLCVAPPPMPAGQNRTTIIRYEALTEIAALRWLPFKPSTSGELNINCPFQGAARDSFISAIKGNAGQGVQGGQPAAGGPPAAKSVGRNLKSSVSMHLDVGPTFINKI